MFEQPAERPANCSRQFLRREAVADRRTQRSSKHELSRTLSHHSLGQCMSPYVVRVRKNKVQAVVRPLQTPTREVSVIGAVRWWNAVTD